MDCDVISDLAGAEAVNEIISRMNDIVNPRCYTTGQIIWTPKYPPLQGRCGVGIEHHQTSLSSTRTSIIWHAVLCVREFVCVCVCVYKEMNWIGSKQLLERCVG